MSGVMVPKGGDNQMHDAPTSGIELISRNCSISLQ